MSSYDDDRDNEVLDLATNEFVSIERKVKAYTTFDWQSQWQLLKNLKVTFGIFNLFNARPPLSLTTNGGGQMIGYNADFSNPQDRTWYGNVTLKF
jgi:iron complex outermembrane receptor protein